MFRYLAAAAIAISFILFGLGAAPVQAQGDPTPTNTPRPTPTSEGSETPTHTPTVAPATNTPPPPSPPTGEPPPSSGGGGQNIGSIRGTIYEDKNNDGRCVGQNEPPLSGIVIRFISNDGQTTVFLESGGDGSYGLVAAGLGTWQVSAIPPAGYSVSSAAVHSVFLDQTQPVAVGVDFCIRRGAIAAPGPAVLPASGAVVAPAILFLTFTGLVFILVGVVMQRPRSVNRRMD
ncbi:MAG: hypothetical protein KJ063_10510 [Anaerolineae bacterium]|nr:hypothetical protein [Anaerolineae bacterium]